MKNKDHVFILLIKKLLSISICKGRKLCLQLAVDRETAQKDHFNDLWQRHRIKEKSRLRS